MNPGEIVLALLLIAVGLYMIVIPWHLRWGAGAEETRRAMPGDEMVASPKLKFTHAITVRRPADKVWPWIVQIGCGRAGWYSYDWLDNLGKPSAEHVVPELQVIQVGDWVPMSGKIDERTAFRVAAFKPNRMLLWTKPDSTWSWVLEPIDAHHTRVVSRLRCHHEPGSLLGFAGILLMEIGDFPMFRKLLINLRRRAEVSAAVREGERGRTAGLP